MAVALWAMDIYSNKKYRLQINLSPWSIQPAVSSWNGMFAFVHKHGKVWSADCLARLDCFGAEYSEQINKFAIVQVKQYQLVHISRDQPTS